MCDVMGNGETMSGFGIKFSDRHKQYRARNPPRGTFRVILKISAMFRVVEIEKFA
jgi:hypothetical protein